MINLENENPAVLLPSKSRFFKFLPGEQEQTILCPLPIRCHESGPTKHAPCGSSLAGTAISVTRSFSAIVGDASSPVQCPTLEVHDKDFRSHSGEDSKENVIAV
jgi:hypothetical protein